jgi:NADH-quinone oxidoreductase subunit N
MLFASSANDFTLLFVSLELITVTFYVLTSFQRGRVVSLEAGVKYLIIGALSTAFTVFGIALVYGIGGELNFEQLREVAGRFQGNKIFLLGLLLVIVGLGFKIAAFPFQIWAPDVYQGAPAPTTAFLAVGSKAAGFRPPLEGALHRSPGYRSSVVEFIISHMRPSPFFTVTSPAIPQRNIKRLLGYSSISHAGYMLLGIAALSTAGQSAVLFYLGGYLFTILGAFTVICLVLRQLEDEDISAFAGLSQRSPLLAAAMTLAMVSLGGIPPLAGFFGKFLLFKGGFGARVPAARLLLGGHRRDHRCGHLPLLLFQRGAGDVLVKRRHRAFRLSPLHFPSRLPLYLHCRHAVHRNLSESPCPARQRRREVDEVRAFPSFHYRKPVP